MCSDDRSIGRGLLDAEGRWEGGRRVFYRERMRGIIQLKSEQMSEEQVVVDARRSEDGEDSGATREK